MRRGCTPAVILLKSAIFMKTRILLAASLSGLLSSCVVTPVVVDPAYPPGPGPGPGPMPGYVDSPAEARRLGEALGRDDRRDGRSHYAGRYRGRVPSYLWSSFVSGYEPGYHSYSGGSWPGGPGDMSSSVYQSGHRAGRLDRMRGLPPNYRRHLGEFPPRFEESFRRGYSAGWY